MPIRNNSYNNTNPSVIKPLLIGCSGGGGQITGIEGIATYLEKKYPNFTELVQHKPILHANKAESWIKTYIYKGSHFTNNIYLLSPLIQNIISFFTNYPLLPEMGDLKSEVSALAKKEEKMTSRRYVDMLLDVFPAGYESAAIWNVLLKKEKTTDLKKLIALQYISDDENYKDICSFFSEKLNNAAQEGSPYTEIISTTSMGLPALCDTVKTYHATHPDKSQLTIRLYMSDLPTIGAVHFFNALSILTPEQQQKIELYGVCMYQKTLNHYFPNGHHFKGVYDIPTNDNPMMRPGFTNPDYDNSKKFNTDVTIKTAQNESFTILKNEQIASIMLGSLASHDTVEYIETLFDSGIDKVFVFGGKIEAISEKIDVILARRPEYKERVIRLGNQGDKEIAQLMTRSNMIFMRAGGMSVMEQMAMRHNKEQTIFLHHANTNRHELTSGISWEDDNVTALIADLNLNKKIRAEKTSPERAKRHIPEAMLITAAKKFARWSPNADTIADYTRDIQALDYKKLRELTASLPEFTDRKTSPLFQYLSECQNKRTKDRAKENEKAQSVIDSLMIECNACTHYFQKIIERELTFLEFPVNIQQAIKDSEQDIFANMSPAFFAAVASYKALEKLQFTLTQDSGSSPLKKLYKFKNEYENPATRQAILYSNDNFVMRFFREVNYQLSKIFIVNYCLGLDRFFTPSQKIRRQMELVIPKPIESVTPAQMALI